MNKSTYSMPVWLYVIILIPIVLYIIAFNLDTRPRDTAHLVETRKGGIVLITNEIDAENSGMGTGFILNDNQIVTNLHVVEGNGKLMVISPNTQKRYAAKILHQDPIADIAVIQVEDWESYKKNELPVNLTLGNSDETVQGEKIVVVGHPWGLTWTVSEGIMSSKGRRLGSNPKFLDQVDAKLFQGNSGGPIFNEEGEVVCISNMMLTKEGGSYGFCIPSNLVKKVMYDFEKFGELRWRAMNVTVGLTPDGSSVILNEVEPDGAAGKAGLKSGDKILEIYTPNNHPKGLKPKDANDIITELAQLRGDDEVIKVVIERNGEKIMIDVKSNYRLSKEYTPDKAK
jgi:serine protease Do